MDIIDVHSLTKEQIREVLSQAASMKRALAKRERETYGLAIGKDLLAALLFYENSTRTRNSFEIAAKRLGFSTVGFSGIEGTSVKKGESLRHTIDMFEAYGSDIVILRHPLDGAARFAADHLGIPVFNAGDGAHEHPTQTLLDLFTIDEHLGKLDGIHVGLSGDLKYGRTVHSLAVALAKFSDITLHLFSHPILCMPASIIAYLEESGVRIVIHESKETLLGNVDILYQTRIQRERMPDETEYAQARDACRITLADLDKTKDRFGLMHPLPIDKGYPEISPNIDGNEKALFKVQAGNGVPTRLVEIAIATGLLRFTSTGEREKENDEEFISDVPIIDKPQKQDVSLMPIRDRGTVIDHLIPGTAQKLMYLLKVEERNDVYRGGTVRSRSNREKVKAMLMIEDRELTPQELRIVAAISPGARVNRIVGAQVVQKISLSLPPSIEGIRYVRCPNTNCVTRPEHQEHISAKFVRTNGMYRCHYCDTLVHGKDIV